MKSPSGAHTVTQPRIRQGLVLGMSTLAFTVCFMVWMMFAVLGVPIKELLQLNETQFGLLAATPVLTGSLVRLPLGLLTDRFGGRIVFFLLMLACVLPVPDHLRHRLLAVPGAGPVCRPGWRFVFGGHRLCRQMVRQGEPGLCHGRVWRRQRRGCGHQI